MRCDAQSRPEGCFRYGVPITGIGVDGVGRAAGKKKQADQ